MTINFNDFKRVYYNGKYYTFGNRRYHFSNEYGKCSVMKRRRNNFQNKTNHFTQNMKLNYFVRRQTYNIDRVYHALKMGH